MKNLKQTCRAAALVATVAGFTAFAGDAAGMHDKGKGTTAADASMKADGKAHGMAKADMAGMDKHKFAMKMHAMNDMELAMAELALEKGGHADLKAYAEKLKTDHTAAHEELKAMATARGMEFKCNDMMAMHMDAMGSEAKTDQPMADESWTGTGGSGAAGTTTMTPGMTTDKEPIEQRNKTAMPDDTRTKSDAHAQAGHGTIAETPAGTAPKAGNAGTTSENVHMGKTGGHDHAAMMKNNPHMAEHMKTMARLRALQGVQFDREFASVMVKDHEKAIKKVKMGQKKFAADKELKAHLDKQLPVLELHHKMALDLTRKLKPMKAAGRRPMTE